MAVNVTRMAWRNVWRNGRRTVVTVCAMTLALFAMIQYSGLFRGYLEMMERNILDLEMGEVQVFAEGYLDRPSIYTRIGDYRALLERLDREGYRASARLLGGGLLAGKETSSGAVFRGVDPERDERVSDVYRHVELGKWLDPGAPDGVVIGRGLARTLNVTVGDELVVLSQGADGSMANDLFRVRGILKNIGQEVDRGGVYMLEDTYRELMVVPDGAHQIIVRSPKGTPLAEASAWVSQRARGLDVKTWKERMPTLASMLESTEAAMYTMFLIVFLAIGIVILNAMLMAVFERIREFGILKAVGVGPGGVLRLIFAEAAIQTGLAIVLGVALSLPVSWYLSTSGLDLSGMAGFSISGVAFDPVWRSAVTTKSFTDPIATLVAIVALAVLYPAFKAAFIGPLDAMRHR